MHDPIPTIKPDWSILEAFWSGNNIHPIQLPFSASEIYLSEKHLGRLGYFFICYRGTEAKRLVKRRKRLRGPPDYPLGERPLVLVSYSYLHTCSISRPTLETNQLISSDVQEVSFKQAAEIRNSKTILLQNHHLPYFWILVGLKLADEPKPKISVWI